MAVAFPDCYDCENASSINGELWCSLFFNPCSQIIACSRNAPKPGPKPTTNADRIRSMTDEELAGWIYTHRWNDFDGLLDWLKEEGE